MKDPVLSVVIVTWNALGMLKNCLKRIPAATAGLSFEVTIVDNGSVDGTADWLQTSEPAWLASAKVKYHLNLKNVGVARARNQGIRFAAADYLCLLDVDTEPQAASLQRLVMLLNDYPKVGLVGPQLIHPDGSLQYSCRRFPTLPDKLGRRLPAWLTPGLARLAQEAELRSWGHDGIREVDYVIGACQLLRRAALNDVGLLDERIFYGPEDVDICLRMWRRGWRVIYLPHALVIHRERRVTRRLLSWLALRHLAGLAYYFAKHRYLFRAPVVRTGGEFSDALVKAKREIVA